MNRAYAFLDRGIEAYSKKERAFLKSSTGRAAHTVVRLIYHARRAVRHGWVAEALLFQQVQAHEFGHYYEGLRQGLNPDKPVFTIAGGGYVSPGKRDPRMSDYERRRMEMTFAGPEHGLTVVAMHFALGLTFRHRGVVQAAAFGAVRNAICTHLNENADLPRLSKRIHDMDGMTEEDRHLWNVMFSAIVMVDYWLERRSRNISTWRYRLEYLSAAEPLVDAWHFFEGREERKQRAIEAIASQLEVQPSFEKIEQRLLEIEKILNEEGRIGVELRYRHLPLAKYRQRFPQLYCTGTIDGLRKDCEEAAYKAVGDRRLHRMDVSCDPAVWKYRQGLKQLAKPWKPFAGLNRAELQLVRRFLLLKALHVGIGVSAIAVLRIMK